MQIERDRMVHLGYSKYWRSEHILGLLPIEEDRGPGRRTHVYVTGREEPVEASRTEEAILDDLLVEAGEETPGELGEAVKELLAELRGLPPVIRRMLRNEADFQVRTWIARLSELAGEEDPESEDGQEELFPEV